MAEFQKLNDVAAPVIARATTDYYLARIAGKPVDHPDTPQAGRYRLPARRTNTSQSPGAVNPRPPISRPVAIWMDDFSDLLIVRIGKGPDLVEGSSGFHEFCDRSWPLCQAVPQDQYDAVIAGGSWPDEHDAVTRSNRAPDPDSFEGLRDAIVDLAREATELIGAGAARDKEQSDRAADLANRLGELCGAADKARETEKKPHLDAGREVDAKWRPLISAAEVYKRLKSTVCAPFLAAQKRAAEEERFRALTTGTPEAALPEAKATAGTRGRPVSLRTEKHVEITDIAALFDAFRDNAELQDCLRKLATRAVRAGAKVPGVKVTETQVAA